MLRKNSSSAPCYKVFYFPRKPFIFVGNRNWDFPELINVSSFPFIPELEDLFELLPSRYTIHLRKGLEETELIALVLVLLSSPTQINLTSNGSVIPQRRPNGQGLLLIFSDLLQAPL